jgi:protein-S-isoprenylcysteine O-methyltransferase Ste14
VLGAVCLLNLGRSFGILIALREVKTGGLYSVVRHPMYGTDILLRIGFLVSHLNWRTAAVFVLSTACYVYRAFLEERFLSQGAEYREYVRRVPYRFLPRVY